MYGRVERMNKDDLRTDFEQKSKIYFNACKNAQFEKSQRLFKLIWRFKAFWYRWLALQYSNQFVRRVPLADLAVVQLRTRSQILYQSRNFDLALDCLDVALSKKISLAEKAACEIEKGDIFEMMGKREEAQSQYMGVWQIRSQLPDDILEDLISSLSTHFSGVGNPAKSLDIFKEGERLMCWRTSVRN